MAVSKKRAKSPGASKPKAKRPGPRSGPASDASDARRDLIDLLVEVAGTGQLPPDLQRRALRTLATLVEETGGAGASHAALAARAGLRVARAAAVGNRRLVYVHGICRHPAGFSSPWWDALHPFVPGAFGPGVLGQTRLEVVWSDLVNRAAVARAAAPHAGLSADEQARRQAAAEIKEALRDRADQHMLSAAVRADGLAAAAAPAAALETSALVSIPVVDCIDDFSVYLVDDEVRQGIIDRFIAVVRPELQAGHELDVIAHSWGTVVAYEGLRQMEDEGLAPALVRNLFTVGAALSIGPVKLRLRPANRDGRKPASVRRWVNLDAHGDIVGGPLKGRPYAVDLDFVNLAATGCSSFLGIVSPSCAHGSYFDAGNVAVNRGIFARFIDQP